jgi:hypothetical protein
LDVRDFPGGLALDRGIHVHARTKAGKLKAIEATGDP